MYNSWILNAKKAGVLTLAVLAFFAPGVSASMENEINWSGVEGPFRFQNYCSPHSGTVWSAAGSASVSFQSTAKGFFETRDFKLLGDGAAQGLYGIWFDEKGNGWVVGDDGLLFHSKDNGYSWESQDSRTKEDLRAITCFGSSDCWAVGMHGVFLRTTNGGKTWNSFNNVSGGVIDFVNTSNGWVSRRNDLLQTQDGGRTWLKIVDNGGASFVYADLFESVKFIDTTLGWAAGGEKLGYTSDGGKSWKVTRIRDADFIGVVATNEKEALAVNRGEFNYCTKDSGSTWGKCFPRQNVK